MAPSDSAPKSGRDPPAASEATERQRGYWRKNLLLVGVLLAVWFGVSCGLGILLVKPLNTVSIGGAPLGFWIAQQGSIYIFLLLILIYAVAMDRLDRAFQVDEPGSVTDASEDDA